MVKFVLLILLAALIGCGRKALDVERPAVIAPSTASRPSQPYRFVHYETTGITSYVETDAKTLVAIQFTRESNQRALALLDALKPGVYLANTDDGTGRWTGGNKVGGIFLIGQLHDRALWTISGPNLPGSEPFREFTLVRWYIAAPILDRGNDENNADEPRKVVRRAKLEKSDFERTNVSDNELHTLQRAGN